MIQLKHTAHYPELDIEFINTKGVPLIIGCTLTSEEKPFSIGPSDTMDKQKRNDNQFLLSKMLKTSPDKMIFLKQKHSSDIFEFYDDEAFPSVAPMEFVGEYDAAISNVSGSQINLSLADCAGVILYHPKSNKVAAIHSGWKGTKKSITEKTLDRMAGDSGIVQFAKELLVWFMPSAAGENYEVGKEFKEYFPNSVHVKGDRLYFDNRKEIERRLLSMGVKKDNIFHPDTCTISDKRYHSYRRDGDKAGRMNAFVKLEE